MTATNHPRDESADLAEIAKRWRRGGADAGAYVLSQETAAAMLGMSVRTYQGIEQGRGFRYPALLVLAIQGFASLATDLVANGVDESNTNDLRGRLTWTTASRG